MLFHIATATNTSSLGDLVLLARRCFARCFSHFFGEHIDKNELNSRRICSQYAHNIVECIARRVFTFWKKMEISEIFFVLRKVRKFSWNLLRLRELLKNSL